MSTRKRLLILTLCHLAFLVLFVIFIVIASRTFMKDVQMGLSITYSLIIIAFFAIMGVVARKLSCRFFVIPFGLFLCWSTITLTLTSFNLAYSPDDIKAINGMNPQLSAFEDIGWSYIIYSFAVFVGFYAITAFIIFIKQKIKANRVVDKLAESKKPQLKVTEAMFLKAYNKRTNTFDKYLIYRNNKNKLCTSARIIYYDSIELIAVDSDHRIFAMFEEPTKISRKEFVQLNIEENNCKA
jgi:hypothetical protein